MTKQFLIVSFPIIEVFIVLVRGNIPPVKFEQKETNVSSGNRRK